MTAPAALGGAAAPPKAHTCKVRVRVGKTTAIDLTIDAAAPSGIVATNVATDFLAKYLPETGAPDTVPDDKHRGYLFKTAEGVIRTLDPTKSLTEEQIYDGDTLRIEAAPAAEEFQAFWEQVSTAVREFSRKHFPPARLKDLRAMLAIATSVSAAFCLVLLLAFCAPLRSSWVGLAICGATVATLALAWVLAVRRENELVSGVVLPLLLLASSVSAAYAVAAGSPLHGPSIAAGSFVALGVSSLGVLRGRAVIAYMAVGSTAFFVGLAEVLAVDSLLPVDLGVCLGVSAIVIVLWRVEIFAQWLAKIPLNKFPSGTNEYLFPTTPGTVDGKLSEDIGIVNSADIQTRTIRANELIAGMLIGCGVGAAALLAVIGWIHPFSIGWVLYGAAVPVILILRMFHFAPRLHLGVLLFGGIGSALAFLASLSASRGLLFGAIAAATITALLVLGPKMIPTRKNSQNPTVRLMRAAFEGLLILAVLLAPGLYLLGMWSFIYHHGWQGVQ
ncbi:hypothetical protein PP352_21515 [Mycobacteroides abscessus]|nr:hypothetical protein [Mycobacteroides abscessus]